MKGDIAIDDISYENCGVKTCDVDTGARQACGTPGIGEYTCTYTGCCYDTTTRQCYQKAGIVDPKILVAPVDYTGDESDTVTMMCAATSNPNPRYSWSRASGAALDRAEILKDGTLVITDASYYDTG